MKIVAAILCLLFITGIVPVSGQTIVQDLYNSAKQHAYGGEYKLAKKELNTILLANARHYDAKLLLAQVYAWNAEYQLSLSLLSELIHEFTPTSEAYEMFARIKSWQEEDAKCLKVCEAGLNLFPDHTPLHLLKAHALIKLKQSGEAEEVLHNILARDSSHTEAKQLLEQLSIREPKNSVTFGYRHARFSNTFTPWQQATLSYRRNTPWGPLIARMNTAYMFDQTGIQYELDAYPKISQKSYAYLNAGISNNRIFPNSRLGAEYYRILPLRFEVSGGLSILNFEDVHVYLYTIQLGHYFNNYWASARGFVASMGNSNEVTGSLILRRYLEHQDHYVTLYATSGATPLQVISLNEIRRIDARSIGLGYQYPAFNKTLLIKAKMEYQQETYEEIRNTDRFALSFSLEKRF